MQYMLLIYEDESVFGDEKDNPALDEIVGKHMAFANSLGDRLRGGAGLKGTPTATTVRTSAGSQTIHDGPFAETKEQLGGYYLVECNNLDEAIQWAAKIPHAASSAIEIRPVVDFTQVANA